MNQNTRLTATIHQPNAVRGAAAVADRREFYPMLGHEGGSWSAGSRSTRGPHRLKALIARARTANLHH